MLDMIDTQDKLKNFSEDQLIKEMQMPSGSAPQFMVLGEIERRKRMRADSQRQEGLMQPTVAQEAVNGAGVPQGGLAGIAQSLAPKTDMTQNTGVPNAQAAALPAQPNQPQKMAGGGIMRLAVGGDMSLGTLPNIAYFKATHPDVYEQVKDDPEALRMYAELFAPGGSRDAEITGLEALETPRKMDLLKRAFRDPTRGMIKDQQKRDAEMFGADYAADQSRQSMENSMTAVMTDDPTGLFAEGAPVEYLPSVPPTVDPEPVVAETDLGPAGQFGPVAYAERARIADERNAARLQEIKLQGELDDLKVPEADPETGFIPRHPGDKLFYQQQAAGGQGTDDDVDQRTYANIGSTELNTPKIRNALDTDNGAGLLTEIRNAAQNGADNSSQNLVGGLASIEEAARKAEAARMMSVNEIPEPGEVPFGYSEMHGGVEEAMAERAAEAARMMSVNEIPEPSIKEVPFDYREMHGGAEAEMAARKAEAARMMSVNEIPEPGEFRDEVPVKVRRMHAAAEAEMAAKSGDASELNTPKIRNARAGLTPAANGVAQNGVDNSPQNLVGGLAAVVGQAENAERARLEQAKNQQDIYDFLAGAEGAPDDNRAIIDQLSFKKDRSGPMGMVINDGLPDRYNRYFFPEGDELAQVTQVNRAAQDYLREAHTGGLYKSPEDIYDLGPLGRLKYEEASDDEFTTASDRLAREKDARDAVKDDNGLNRLIKEDDISQAEAIKRRDEAAAWHNANRGPNVVAEFENLLGRPLKNNYLTQDAPFAPRYRGDTPLQQALDSGELATDPRSPLGAGGKSAGIIAAKEAAREAAKGKPKADNTAVAKIGEELTQREKKANQDKWLALAYAGAELMDSGSFGKAAKAGLGAYSKNIEGTRNYETETKKLDAEIMLRNAQMAAANRKSTGKVPAGIIDNLEDRRAEILAALTDMPFPEERWYGDVLGKPTDPYAAERREMNARLESLTSQINSAYASQGVTMPAGPVRKQA